MMKLSYITCLFLSILLVYSCSNDNTTEYNDDSANRDAQIYSLSVKGTPVFNGDSAVWRQDSARFAILSNTKFAIDQIQGRIYNPEPLPYGLKLGKVALSIGLKTSTSSGIYIKLPDSIQNYQWNQTDSVDFSKFPIEIEIVAEAATKHYTLSLNIEENDPEIIDWTKAGEIPAKLTNIKALAVGNVFYLLGYDRNAGKLNLYKSNNTPVLSLEKREISGLPSGLSLYKDTANINDLSYLNGKFFLSIPNMALKGGFVSDDCENWTFQTNTNDYEIVQIYGILPDRYSKTDDVLLVGIHDGGNYYLGTTKDLSTIDKINTFSDTPATNILGNGFPIDNFSSCTYYDGSGNRNYLLIFGGVDKSGNKLKQRMWTIAKDTKTDGRIERTYSVASLGDFSFGTSLFIYDNQVNLLFGNDFYTSSTWGINWGKVSAKWAFPEGEAKRACQSLVVDDNNYIWVFGGISDKTKESLEDVWRGRLNKFGGK